jgi:YaiO family outer membrane protein
VFGRLDHYFGNFRAGYTLTATRSAGSTVFGNHFVLAYYYNDISHIDLNYGFGHEVERTQNSKIIFDTHFAGVNGRHWLNSNWAIDWDIGQTVQDTAYTRTGGNIGLRRAF